MIKNVKVVQGLASRAERLILDLGFVPKKTVFLSDEKIWRACRKFFPKNFQENFGQFLLLKNPQADEKNLKKISANLKNCDFIFGLGSGTINDLCKFTSAQKKIPYAIFASAASMNGYLSRNASIAIRGHKKTLSATLPVALFYDLKILAAAPTRLTKAGIGDVMCFYSCWFDWYFSHKVFGTKFVKKPFEILAPKMEFLLKNFAKFSLKDEKFLEILFEILLLSGQGMTMAGGSYPASQSEHMIAHTIEMKYPKIAAKKLHGEMIALTSLTSANLQKKLLEDWSNIFDLAFLDCRGVERFFGKKIATECQKEYAQKLLVSKRGKKLTTKTKNELVKIHLDESKLRAIFSHFKISTSLSSFGLSSQQYQACVAYAKFTRQRITCLDFLSI